MKLTVFATLALILMGFSTAKADQHLSDGSNACSRNMYWLSQSIQSEGIANEALIENTDSARTARLQKDLTEAHAETVRAVQGLSSLCVD